MLMVLYLGKSSKFVFQFLNLKIFFKCLISNLFYLIQPVNMTSQDANSAMQLPIYESSPSPSLTPAATPETSSPAPSVTPISDDNDIILKKKFTSDVWSHFKRVTHEGQPKAQCKYCCKYLTARPKDGTTHLREHAKRGCNRRKYGDIRDMRQKVLSNEQNKLTSCHFDQDTARNELASMIILHEFPLSIVDYVGFRKYSSALQPLFKMVSRNTIKRDIFKIYESEKAKVMKFIETNKSRIAVTTDMWTSSNKKRGFMVVTAHYIDDSWILQNRVLRYFLLT